WAMGGRSWDGRLKVAGSLGPGSAGQASLDSWRRDGQPLPGLSMEWQRTPAGRWQASRVAWGDISGECSLKVDKDVRLEASFKEPAGGTLALRGELLQGAAGPLSGTAEMSGIEAGRIPCLWGAPREDGVKGK